MVFNPSDFSIEELEAILQAINDPDILRTLLAAERRHADRDAATAAIRNRLDGLEDLAAGSARPVDVDGISYPKYLQSIVDARPNFDEPPPTPPKASWPLRIKRRLAGRLPIIGLFLVILVITGGWLVFTTHIDPGTHVEQRTVDLFTQSTTFEHRAIVRDQNPVYSEGTTLTNRPVYFTALSPILDGTLVTSYQSSHSDPVRVSTQLTLVIRSMDAREVTSTEYWRLAEPIGRESTTTLQPGSSHRTRFSVNVSDVQARLDRIRDELGTTVGRSEALIVGEVRLEGTVGGERIATEETYSLRIEPRGASYFVESIDTVPRTVSRTEPVTAVNSYGPIRQWGSILLFILSLAGLLAVSSAHLKGNLSLTPQERHWLAYAQERWANNKWITPGTVPAEAFESPMINVLRLQGLADLAIDTDNRIIYDAPRDQYFVITDRFVYTFRPPAEP